MNEAIRRSAQRAGHCPGQRRHQGPAHSLSGGARRGSGSGGAIAGGDPGRGRRTPGCVSVYSKVLQPIDLPEAIAQAEIAAMLEPDTPRFQDHLVKLLVAAGRTDDAARALARALPLNARHGPLYFELSRLLQRLGRPEQALAAARRAVALEPERPSWQGHLAALLIEAGRTGEAEAVLRQALARNVESGGMYFSLSRLVHGRSPQEAIAAARRAVDLEPQKPYFREHLVALLLEAGNDVEAEAACATRSSAIPATPRCTSTTAGCCSAAAGSTRPWPRRGAAWSSSPTGPGGMIIWRSCSWRQAGLVKPSSCCARRSPAMSRAAACTSA